MYCTLCKKHDTYNPQNKAKAFNQDPSTRYRPEALTDHLATHQHKSAVYTELLQRVSVFQIQIDEREKVAEDVVVKAFTSLYWVAKEELANRKMRSLLKHLEDLGMTEMKHFQHRSQGALREMFLTLGGAVEDDLLSSLKKADHYGLMVDEVTDISVYEQMVTFVQFFDKFAGETKTAFLSVDNLLEEASSANSETITNTILKTLEDFELDPKKLSSFVSDGASVMTGKNTGVAKRLKESVNKELINIHCICHRLALACTDTLEDVSYIKQVQLWLVQLWKLFENSCKKLAVYLKIQTELKGIKLSTEESRQGASRRLKKACQTRWLSFNQSNQAIFREYPAVLQTLNNLQSSDAAALGLLTKIRNVKFLSTVYILSEILPHLDTLSKTFQKGTTDFSRIGPSIDHTKDKLDEIRESMAPVSRLYADIQPGGRLGICEMEVTDCQIETAKSLLVQYIDVLKRNLDRRFEESLPVLSALAVLDPLKVPNKNHPGFKLYGNRQIGIISTHFTINTESEDRPAVIDEINAEWGKLKYDMLSWKEDIAECQASGILAPTMTSTEWCLQRICQLPHFYPRLSKIADVVLSTPVSNAWPERGASAVKRIKTRLRSSIKNDMLQALLHVSINGPEPGSVKAKGIINQAVSIWLKKKNRRKLPKKGKIVPRAAAHSQETSVTTSDACIQTEGIVSAIPVSREEVQGIIREEIYAYTKALDLPSADQWEDDDYSDDDCF